ncbi:methionine/alanine import family NSS transporter small subunit [Priestia megaterium]|nr:methionine/alanine import family NSS transporter small subunit [Priestia megaterium]
MESSSIAMMIVGMIIIWGGLAVSILHAVKKAKESKV